MARDYSSIYKIKDHVVNSLAPKYLNMDTVNDLNVGLFGVLTDLIGSIADDNFNTTTTYMNEMFPNRAILPETIYNDAALFQEDDFFTTPAEMMAWLFILEEDIIKYASAVPDGDDSQKQIFLDSDMIINIEGIPFMMDYDLRIRYVIPDGKNLVYTVEYDKVRHGTTYTSSLVNDNTKYIKSRVIQYLGQNYIAMYVKLHQVKRFTEEHVVVNNDVINAPFFNVTFNDNIASFEVFCKNPGETKYTQLKKKIFGSAPEKGVPFCYYKMVDENELEISFTIKDGYYKPAFGAEIIIDYTSTLGKDGEFELYTGSDIICNGISDKYPYNSKLIIFCITQSPSQFAKSKMSLDDLKIRNVENRSTVKSYTTENDLDLYFSRFGDKNIKMYTIKKRNDMIERLFSSFALYRNDENDIIKTNTLPIRLSASAEVNNGKLEFGTSFDKFIKVDGRGAEYYIPAGTVFVYDNDGQYITPTEYTMSDYAEYIKGTNDYFKDTDFVYVNPFVIYMTTNPTLIGYYLNTMNQSYPLDYYVTDTNTFTQFICGPLNVSRDALAIDDSKQTYAIKLLLTPTTNIDPVLSDDRTTITIYTIDNKNVIGTFYADTGIPVENSDSEFSAMLMFGDNSSEGYIPLKITHYDRTSTTFTIEGEIKTDDYITENNFRVTNLTSNSGGNTEYLEPMYDSPIRIKVFIGDDLANTYVTMDGGHVTFIKPLNMCKSDVKFDKASVIDTIPPENIPETGTDEHAAFTAMVDTFIYNSPMVGLESIIETDDRIEFFNKYNSQYLFIEDILEDVTNNYGIDLKFYNTYGKSKNFHVEGGDLIDSVNISIRFEIKPVHGTDTEILVRDIKYFIKNYIETINDNNTNAIYISNLIKELENRFTAIKYIKFGKIKGIQEYSLETQAIENLTSDINDLSPAARREYVPEYLTIDIDDVHIVLI